MGEVGRDGGRIRSEGRICVCLIGRILRANGRLGGLQPPSGLIGWCKMFLSSILDCRVPVKRTKPEMNYKR